MKANHNLLRSASQRDIDVSDTSKILKWKQITTSKRRKTNNKRCFRYFKDTKMKANHNLGFSMSEGVTDVSDTSKILKWKQITTDLNNSFLNNRCFRYFKDTKMKANHNCKRFLISAVEDVSDTSKILKWKQITTPCADQKSFHTMFPILQRY